MKSRKNTLLAFLLVALSASVASAQQRVLTPEAILATTNITDAQLSPDGQRIIFQAARPRRDDEKPGAAISQLWLMPAKGGQPEQFTFNDKGDRLPRWSPDGTLIAFLSQRGDSTSTQIYVISPTGGEAVQLTKSESSVSSFEWSPDGSRIAYIVKDPKTKEEQENEKQGKDWVVADQNYKHTRLHVIDVKTRESKLITSQTLTVQEFEWSPDGKQFLLGITDTPNVDDSYMRVRLVTIPAGGGEPKLVARTEGKLTNPGWSPDGKWISWLGATSIDDPFAGSVFIVPSSGGTQENLNVGYKGTADWLGWLPGKPSTIVFRSIEGQVNLVSTISLPDKKKEVLLPSGLIWSSGPSFSRDGRTLVIAANSPTHPNEVFLVDTTAKKPQRLTQLNPHLNGVAFGAQEIVKWKSVDGWDIEGVLVKPVGFQRGVRYPLVMQAHGGPEGADLNGWLGTATRWGQMLAGRGFATFYPNYRGSIGRGVDFSKGDHRDLMGKEFQDMLTGIDHLIKEGIADGDRVGVGGGSYGGYTSAWAATYGSERFKAAVAWMGISNWYSMTGTSDIFTENSTVHWNAIMYENYELYLDRSPIRHIKKANTPTLIVHGAVDPRVPIGQSQELYTALKWKGVPVEFVTYPREGHGVQEKAHQMDFMTRVTAWFEKYLKPDLASKK